MPIRIEKAGRRYLLITYFDQARHALSKALTLDSIKHVLDDPEALHLYMEQARMAKEMQGWCLEIARRAENAAERIRAKIAENPSRAWTGTCVLVKDADTIVVRTRDRGDVEVRFFGIDCPEDGQPYSSEGALAVSRGALRLPVKVQDMGTERYGRTLGWVTVSTGTVINEALLEMGLAWWFEKYVPDRLDLRDKERQARELKHGLWSDPNPEPPWEYRHRQKKLKAAGAATK